jgi:hypothetical protein
MSRNLKQLSTGISLVILSLGFSLLGALSFFSRAEGNLPIVTDLEKNCHWLGSSFSIFAGLIFLAAAYAHWRR